MEELKRFVDGLDEEGIEVLREYIENRKKPPVRLEIPYKFPSLNQYVNECRKNPYAGANMKKRIQENIGWYIKTLPVFTKPVTIDFTWIEKDKKRDYDNICASKKFILDALVEQGKLVDDNRKVVTAFRDNFEYGDDWKVILDIYEVE